MRPEIECRDIVRQDHNLSKTIRFLGAQDHLSTIKTLKASNLYVSASRFESFGISIQEANQLGIPLMLLRGGNAASHVTEAINGWVTTSISELVRIFETLVLDSEQFRMAQERARVYQHPYPDLTDETITALVASIKSKLGSV